MATRALAEVRADLADQVDAQAAAQQRPPVGIVEEALAGWLGREARRHRETLQAIANADAGQVVDHARVMTWWRSLGTDTPLPRPQPIARR